jgi:hypothetical protein
VTLSSWPPYSPEKPSEITHGKNIVDAAKEVGVKFFIFRYVVRFQVALEAESNKCEAPSQA